MFLYTSIFCLMFLTGVNFISAADQAISRAWAYVVTAQQQAKTQAAVQASRSNDPAMQPLLGQNQEHDKKKAANVVKPNLHQPTMVYKATTAVTTLSAEHAQTIDPQVQAQLAHDALVYEVHNKSEFFIPAVVSYGGNGELAAWICMTQRRAVEQATYSCCTPAPWNRRLVRRPWLTFTEKVGRTPNGISHLAGNYGISDEDLGNAYAGAQAYSDGTVQFKLTAKKRRELANECSSEQLYYLKTLFQADMARRKKIEEVPLRLNEKQFADHCSLLPERRTLVERNYKIELTDKQKEALAGLT